MPEPVILYGATDCDDTDYVCSYLHKYRVQFREVNIDHDAEAERFVIFINNGYRSTPTLVIGTGKVKTILTEPTNTELDDIIARIS